MDESELDEPGADVAVAAPKEVSRAAPPSGAGQQRRAAPRGCPLMSVTADTVRQLRERTGAGMMECKSALVETNGDLDAAAELMRKQGLAKADKKAARVAAEGVIAQRAGRRRQDRRAGRGQLRDRLRRAR